MTSAFGGPRADVVLTSAGHVALPGAATCQPVCFYFSENLLFNSKNCFKLKKIDNKSTGASKIMKLVS